MITSTMKLQDQFTRVIEHSVLAMERMVDTMENINRSSGNLDLADDFADIRRDIALTNHALDGFNEELDRVPNQVAAVNRLGDSFGGLSKSIIVINQGIELINKGINALDRFGSASDARVSADARLAIINDGLRTQEQLEAQVMRVANETRSEYEATAELVARMGRQDYFKGDNNKALAFAATLNKGLIVSGASAMEAKSALTQLSQGIASGVLRGEEFNSIMENGSVLAEMMATSLGVTKGQLREMAQEGQLTTQTVVSAIMAQSAAIDEQFASMPTTYGQAKTALSNVTSQIMNSLAQPGEGVDILVTKMQALDDWLQTVEGAQALDAIANGVSAIVSGMMWLGDTAGSVFVMLHDNWGTVEPILWGITTAIVGLNAAMLIYKGITVATAAITAVLKAHQMLATGATVAQTAAQWGLNAAMLANPMTWVVIAIVAVIAALVALGVWLYRLWQNNIDFRVGVISAWNSVLNFFDSVPVFFAGIGIAVANKFSETKEMVLVTLEELVNGAIDRINRLIAFANNIPGVSIDVIDNVSFGTEAAIAEQAKREARNANLAAAQMAAAEKASGRERQLQADADRWRAEAAEKEAAQGAEADDTKLDDWLTGTTFPSVKVAGGQVDITKESLEYLNDIAEVQVLESIQSSVGLQLSKQDADLMQAAANSNTNIYYINYRGGVKVNADVRNGENWEDIRSQIERETQDEIDAGMSDLEGVVFG
ncbi:MAG: tape measure protein [Candidatus Fimivivens sp.]